MKPLSSVVMVTVVLIAVSGCASKSWVEEELDRREARITAAAQDAAWASTRREAQALQQRLGALDQRIWALESRAADLQGQAQGATTRAEGAMARADGVDARLTRLLANRSTRTVVNILHIDFAFDQAALDPAAKSVLFVLVRELRGDPRLGLDLEGYTDSKGSRQYNVRLSQRRIEAVQGYFLEQGVERHRLKASAHGPLQNVTIPEERKRRVDIKLVVAAD